MITRKCCDQLPAFECFGSDSNWFKCSNCQSRTRTCFEFSEAVVEWNAHRVIAPFIHYKKIPVNDWKQTINEAVLIAAGCIAVAVFVTSVCFVMFSLLGN